MVAFGMLRTAPLKDQMLSLREGGQWDQQHQYTTGWAKVCKARTGPQSKSQRRKQNSKR